MATDSKERVGAAAALHDYDRFRSVADTAPVMLWVTEPDGQCSFLSRGWRDFTGQEEETGLAAGWLDPLHPEERPSVEAAFTAAAAKRIPFNLEYRLRRRDGVYRWVIDSGRPRFGDEGVYLGYVGIVIDITERQQKELDLRHSREQLELLSDTVPALISYVGADRRYLTCNALYSKWFGLPREKIVGQRMEDVLGAKAWGVVGPYVERAFSGEPCEYEAEVDYRHGGKRWIHARYTPHRDEQGEIVGHRHLGAARGRARARAARGHRRLVRRCDRQQDARRQHHELERRGSAAVRLYGRGSYRSADHDADSR
jgi:PAS domain S-box-containing protein